MPSAAANGITIEYDTTGDASAPPMLLIMGLGGQLTAWDDVFVTKLAERGFYVIRYDNRDVGKSTWFDEAGVPDMVAALAAASGGGDTPTSAYLLSDMATDAAGLLDALGIAAAHIVGASMGGMIAQSFAIAYPQRTLTLTSIMSTTGDRAVGQPHPEAMAILMGTPPTEREAIIDQGIAGLRVIGSPAYPFDEAEARARAGEAYDRAFHPAGTGRQLVAIVASGDRTADLKALDIPTLVIHGEDDPLVDVSGGKATAAAISGARLVLLPGVGHDMPPALHDTMAEAIAGHAVGVTA